MHKERRNKSRQSVGEKVNTVLSHWVTSTNCGTKTTLKPRGKSPQRMKHLSETSNRTSFMRSTSFKPILPRLSLIIFIFKTFQLHAPYVVHNFSAHHKPLSRTYMNGDTDSVQASRHFYRLTAVRRTCWQLLLAQRRPTPFAD